MNRLLILLYLLDSFVLGLITLGNCRIGETISSVAYITETDGKRIGKIMRPFIDKIMWFNKDHCHQAYLVFNRITGAIR